MEGVGARLGRSSTRYGPTIVFSGPVRKWKKKWIHVSPSNTANHSSSSQSNGNNGSHLLLYKWTPLSQSNNGDKTIANDDNSASASASEEPPRRKFRYVPIAVLEEQNKEAAEKADEEAEPSDTDPSAGVESKSDGSNGKPDINDVPMEEPQASDKDQLAPRELNETNLDLSLGLKAHDGDHDADPKRDQSKDNQPERLN